MKVVRVVGYHQNLKMDEAPKPEITSPLDVIVKIGAAGVCRTDLHILEGQWEEKAQVKLPYTIGHEVGDMLQQIQSWVILMITECRMDRRGWQWCQSLEEG